MSTPRPRTVSIRVVVAPVCFPGDPKDYAGHLAIVYARNGHRWAELGPYAFPEAAEHAARDWASAQGFEVRS